MTFFSVTRFEIQLELNVNGDLWHFSNCFGPFRKFVTTTMSVCKHFNQNTSKRSKIVILWEKMLRIHSVTLVSLRKCSSKTSSSKKYGRITIYHHDSWHSIRTYLSTNFSDGPQQSYYQKQNFLKNWKGQNASRQIKKLSVQANSNLAISVKNF